MQLFWMTKAVDAALDNQSTVPFAHNIFGGDFVSSEDLNKARKELEEEKAVSASLRDRVAALEAQVASSSQGVPVCPMDPPRKGTVYLVGAGPGDLGLLTLRAWHLVRHADAIVHDRLVQQQLLSSVRNDDALSRRTTQFVNVGKGPTKDRFPQSKINETLISLARQGLCVVRLKGGDPFVFGLGGDEGIALRDAGVPFEVVPGVTSALAVPAYAGVPVTQKNVATSFTVISGHKAPGTLGAADWENLPKNNSTLVVLMGVRKLNLISDALIQNGTYGPNTPAVVVQSGTTQAQRTVQAPLYQIALKSAAFGIEPPAMLIVGDAVGLRDRLSWKDNVDIAGDANGPESSSWGEAQPPPVAPALILQENMDVTTEVSKVGVQQDVRGDGYEKLMAI